MHLSLGREVKYLLVSTWLNVPKNFAINLSLIQSFTILKYNIWDFPEFPIIVKQEIFNLYS